MPNLLDLLDGHIFSGVTGNLTYDLLKAVWQRLSQRSWETLYFDAFEQAVRDLRPLLTRHGAPDGEIVLDREALRYALHRDVRIGTTSGRLGALGADSFIADLADALVIHSAVTIGGHALSQDGYTQISRNVIRIAHSHFRDRILADDTTFRQAIMAETHNNAQLASEIRDYLADRFDITIDLLQDIRADVANLPAQIGQLLEGMLPRIQGSPTEREQLLLQLASEREQRWSERYERLRTEVDAGYTAAVRDEIVALIGDLQQHLADDGATSSDLQGRIYRLGAIAFLPSKPGGDIQRCRDYLRLARPHSHGEAASKCEIIAAILTDTAHGLTAALDHLAGIEGEEATRLRFSLALEHEDLAVCRAMIVEGLVDERKIEQDLLWTRPLMFYYAAAGQRDSLLACAEVLGAPGQPADHVEAVALALTRAAFERFRQFCFDHHIFPEFHFGVDLGDLIDDALREQAIICFERAAEAYAHHQCTSDAIRALVSAIRLLMDVPETEQRQRLLDQLRRLDPAHTLLVAAMPPVDDASAAAAFTELERALADPLTEPLLLLHRARQIADEPARVRQIAAMLTRFEHRFQPDPIWQLQFEIAVLELLQKAGTDVDAEIWLARISSPAPYEHTRPLCHIIFYLSRDIAAARRWLDTAVTIAPDHPEILYAATLVLNQSGEHDGAITAAGHLFALLPTPQIALRQLRTLRDGQRFQDIFQVLNQTSNLALSEADRRVYRATALVALEQPMRALADLEWLDQHGEASGQTLITLAQLYLQIHRTADAITILRKCIARHGDEPGGYFVLSRALLMQGQRDESFRVALDARARLPDDPAVAQHLWHLSFSTGHEDTLEVREALAALLPGGPLADAELVTQGDEAAAIAFITADMEADQEANTLYQQGQISLLVRCYMVQMPLCWYHALVQRRRAVQLVAPQIGLDRPTWWDTPKLPAMVVDYTALLTIWVLFGDNLLALLRTAADTVYLPARLLAALDWEQETLASRGQPALNDARADVERSITRHPHRLQLHPLPDMDVFTYDPITAAGMMSAHEQLIYVTAYPSPHPLFPVPAVDLYTLADVLLRAGEIGPNQARALRQHAAPLVENQPAPAIIRGNDIATNTLTLVALIQAGALDGLLHFIGHVHLLEQDWESLRGEIATADLREQTIRDLDRLRAQILRGIEEGFIRAEPLAPEQHLLGLYESLHHQQARELPPLRSLALGYTDELISLAGMQQALLWSDDRWTSLVAMPEAITIDRVSTETMLDWLYSRGALNDHQVYGAHATLIQWGYQGLTIYPGYLRWLIGQGVAPDARSLVEATTRYRTGLLASWTSDGSGTVLGQQLYLSYLLRTVETYLSCFADRAPAEVVSTIVRELDISREWPELEGNEPAHLSDVLVRIVGLIYRRDPVSTPAIEQMSAFSAWLDAALQTADLPREAIDEAWQMAAEQALRIYAQVAARLGQRVVDDLFLKLMLRTMPERSLKALLSSRHGREVRMYSGDMLEPEVVWSIRQPDGTIVQLPYPLRQWQHDYDRAVARAVIQTTNAPITVGRVIIQREDTIPSMWLRFRLGPAELHRQSTLAAPNGTEHFVSLLPYLADHRRTHRQAVWQIIRRQLDTVGISGHTWGQIRLRLLSPDARTWRAAKHQALRFLFSHWPIVRSYLDEAVSFGQPALFEILTRINPNDVRSWLGIHANAPLDAVALTRWAEEHAAGVTLGSDMVAAEEVLRSYLTRVGYSLFPDAVIAREHVVEQILAVPNATDRTGLLHALLELAQATSSTALKANIVLIELQYYVQLVGIHDLDEPTRSVLTAIIVQIAQPFTPNDPQTVSMRLINALTAYLYQGWQPTRPGDAAPMAYFAHMAANWIGEMLVAHVPARIIEELLEEIGHLTDEMLPNYRTLLQPSGLFRPAWSRLLNYAATLLFHPPTVVQESLATLVSAAPARDAVLRCGAQHRVLQEALGIAEIGSGWLDTQRATDLPQTIAALLASQSDSAQATWSEIERYKLVLCQIPEAGRMLLADAIQRLPQLEDDGAVLNTLAMVLLTLDQPGAPGAALVVDLVAPEILARIRRCDGGYALLLWKLTGVLVDPTRFGTALVSAAHGVVMTLPTDMPTAVTVAASTAGVLAHRAKQGQLVGELRVWVERLGGQDELPLPAARAALRMLLHWWPSLNRARDAIRPGLAVLAGVPRFARLWELNRMRDTD